MRLFRLFSFLLAAILLICGFNRATLSVAQPSLIVLAYHEVTDPTKALIPAYAISPARFTQHLHWLKTNGYHFVSVDQVIAAESGRKPLPAKPILLSFDDGYRFTYDTVFPILQDFHASALVGLVGSWMAPTTGSIDFGDQKVPRSAFLTWDQVREMANSGLVEVASHSYDLHKGINGNPQGSQEPASSTRAYDPQQQAYETETAYQKRIRQDLQKNNQILDQELGRKPRVIVWPYGRYNETAIKIARQLGMPLSLTLEDGANRPQAPLRRILISQEMGTQELEKEIALRYQDTTDHARAAKIMHVDLDNIYDPDPEQQRRNLALLLERIPRMGVNTVYLQAFADPDGNGAADALYFPNRHLPMRADLFNYVAWAIRTETQVRRLYAWMPMLAFELPQANPAASHRVVTQQVALDHFVTGYPRLSPFSPLAMRVIREIYEDLSQRATFDGLLFHDDVTLSDYEDASSFGLATYKKWGLPTDLATIRKNDHYFGIWTNQKIKILDDLAQGLANVVRANQPQLQTARNLYAQVVLNPKAETWYAQSLDSSLKHYDFTAVMAMPYLEKAPNPREFLQRVFEDVQKVPRGLEKVVFELQSVDWTNQHQLTSQELGNTIQDLYNWGANHIAYYPENLHRNQPDPDVIRPIFERKSSQPKLIAP